MGVDLCKKIEGASNHREDFYQMGVRAKEKVTNLYIRGQKLC